MSTLLDDPNAIRHLIPRLSRLHREHIRVQLGEMGLYRGQHYVLMQLWVRDGQTASELCQERAIKPSTMTRTLQRMEKGGWITRTKDTEDRRVTRVHLTEAGRKAERQVDDINRALEDQILADMTDAERAIFRCLLMQAVDNIRAMNGD